MKIRYCQSEKGASSSTKGTSYSIMFLLCNGFMVSDDVAHDVVMFPHKDHKNRNIELEIDGIEVTALGNDEVEGFPR